MSGGVGGGFLQVEMKAALEQLLKGEWWSEGGEGERGEEVKRRREGEVGVEEER